jgi:putative transposase
MNRGNRKAPIFEDVEDRRRFLAAAIREKKTYGVLILAGTEMGNHFHGIVNTPNGNLPEFMQHLEGPFARYSNRRHGNVGHVFQGRYVAVLIENDVHLVIALCYNFLNPVCAGLVERPEDYPWSTYAATVGLAPRPDYLSIDWLSTLFPCATLEEAQRRFHSLMQEDKPATAYLRQLEEGVDPAWIRQVVRSYIGEQRQLGTLPRLYRSALRLTLSELFGREMSRPLRAEAIYKARVEHGYTLAEIARELHLSPSAVSKIYRAYCNL